MGADGIDIDLQIIADIAQKIRLLNQDVESCMEGIDKEIRNTNITWTSNAQKQLAQKYSGFQSKKEEFHSDLEAYAKFLVDTVAAYSSTEVSINKNADSFM